MTSATHSSGDDDAADDVDLRRLKQQVRELQERLQRHREIIGKLCKRVMALEEQTKTAQDKIREDIEDEPDISFQELAERHDVTVNYAKQVVRGQV